MPDGMAVSPSAGGPSGLLGRYRALPGRCAGTDCQVHDAGLTGHPTLTRARRGWSRGDSHLLKRSHLSQTVLGTSSYRITVFGRFMSG